MPATYALAAPAANLDDVCGGATAATGGTRRRATAEGIPNHADWSENRAL